jgi:hypothetical protein
MVMWMSNLSPQRKTVVRSIIYSITFLSKVGSWDGNGLWQPPSALVCLGNFSCCNYQGVYGRIQVIVFQQNQIGFGGTILHARGEIRRQEFSWWSGRCVLGGRCFAALLSASGASDIGRLFLGRTLSAPRLSFQGENPMSDLCCLYKTMVAFYSFLC